MSRKLGGLQYAGGGSALEKVILPLECIAQCPFIPRDLLPGCGKPDCRGPGKRVLTVSGLVVFNTAPESNYQLVVIIILNLVLV